MATVADPLGDFQICPAGILEQFGEIRTHVRILFEQQLFEHDAVDADHLHQMGSEKVHGNIRFECLGRCR
ncbi:MAG: hypothetical protein KGK16_12790 [Bradyrhizobium sp.]|uniref:hypothetical protein n=1 Tax=Bradyrhizobium sp. TaxID=376 RepID=UPI00239232F6|nr:hypothetical protein [Bradyrhizobium sp.]MDE2331641.1 hypothetical protein [Bradyrhizobium sp.]